MSNEDTRTPEELSARIESKAREVLELMGTLREI